MPSNLKNHPHELVGVSIDAPDIRAFFTNLDASTEVTEEDGEPRWISQGAGMEVHADNGTRRINTVFLYPEGVDDFHEYKGPLPAGLSFTMSRDQVKARLGRPPDLSGDHHDKWKNDTYGLIVKYKKSGPIRNISLTSY